MGFGHYTANMNDKTLTSSISKTLQSSRKDGSEQAIDADDIKKPQSFSMKTLPFDFPQDVASVLDDQRLTEIHDAIGLDAMMLISPVAHNHLDRRYDLENDNLTARRKRHRSYRYLKWFHLAELYKSSRHPSAKCLKFLYGSDILFAQPGWCDKVLAVPAPIRDRLGIEGMKAFQETSLDLIKRLNRNDFDHLIKTRFYKKHKDSHIAMMRDYCTLPANIRASLDEKDLTTVYFPEDVEPYITYTEPGFWEFYLALPKKIRLNLKKKKIGWLNHAFSSQGKDHGSRINITQSQLSKLAKQPVSFFEEMYKTYGPAWVYVLGLDGDVEDAFNIVRQNDKLRPERWHLEDFELFDILARKTNTETLVKALSSKEVGRDFIMTYIFEYYFSKNICDDRIVDRFLLQAEPYDLYQAILMMEGIVPEAIARKFLETAPDLLDRLEPHIIANLMRAILKRTGSR